MTTDTLDPKPIPSYAIPFWSDGITIFCAVPAKGSTIPHIVKFPHSEVGIASALRLLATRYADVPATQQYSAPMVQTKSIVAKIKLRDLGITTK